MTDQPPGKRPGWQPQPAPGYPAQPPANHRGPKVWRSGLLVGLVIGLVIGASALGLTWALSGSDGVAADAEAVCGIVSRTPEITEETPVEDFRRWGVAEVGPSLAEQDARYEPLNEALEQAMRAMQQFDVEELRAATDRVRQLCDDL